MSREIVVKTALICLLGGAAAIGPTPTRPFGWINFAFLAFGLANVFLSTPGTVSVRRISIAGAVAALTLGNTVAGMVFLLATFGWGPAMLLLWANSKEMGETVREPAAEQEAWAREARIVLAVVIGAVAIASASYRLIVTHNLQQTSALFIGLPALLAILVVVGISPRSATGVACKAVTVALLVSMLVLWEGVLCVLLSAPLFYGVAVAVASSIDMARRRERATITLRSWLLVLVLVPMSLEGVAPFTTLNRDQTVVATKLVSVPVAAVQRALFEPPRFDRGRPRPLFLRLGFPTPTTSRIEREKDASRWVVQLRGGEMLLNGMEARTGDLTLDLEEARAGLMRWRAVSDTSHMTHFLGLRESVVAWEPIDAQTTRVTWTLRYERDLDPAWYFGPMERYAARLAAEYLIDAVATP